MDDKMYLRWGWAAAFIAVLATLAGGKCCAADSARHWLNAQAVQDQLARQVTITWSKVGLRKALASLSDSYSLAIVLDRRVDPEQQVELIATNQPLKDALGKLTADRALALGVVGPVLYIGPPHAAARVRTLSALRRTEAQSLGERERKAFAQVRSWQWKALTPPRDLLEGLAAEAGVAIEGSERIEHDLWPSAEWPALSWTDRLTLLACQFDSTFRIAEDGQRVTLVSLPELAQIEKRINVGRDAAATAARWAEHFPEASFQAEGVYVLARGRVEDIEAVEPNKRTPRKSNARPGKKTYQLRVTEVPLDQVLAQVGKIAELEFEVDRAAFQAAGIAGNLRISVDVHEASLEQLLNAIFEPAGLAHSQNGSTVHVKPRKPR